MQSGVATTKGGRVEAVLAVRRYLVGSATAGGAGGMHIVPKCRLALKVAIAVLSLVILVPLTSIVISTLGLHPTRF